MERVCSQEERACLMLSHGEESGKDSDEWREARGEDGPHCPVSLMRKREIRDTPRKRKERGCYRQNETVKDEEMGRKERTSKKAARPRHRQDETRDWRRGRKTF